jgi:hypothetical protein
MTFLSQNGGNVKVKTAFPNAQGGYGNADIFAAAAQKDPQEKEGMNEDDIVEELDRWCKANLHLVKNAMSEDSDFVSLNKGDRLQKHYLRNFAIEHHMKMILSHNRREAAYTQKEELTETRWEKNKLYLSKWEDYRENKIELTAIFIKVLKRKNFTRRWLIAHKVG